MKLLRAASEHRSRRGGFTLLELAIALTLLGSVILALNRFALGGLAASATNIELADLRRQVAYTQQLMRADLDQARSCDPSGYGTPLLRLDGTSGVKRFAVYTTATADGSIQLVEWRFYPDGWVYRISTAQEWAELCDAYIPISLAAFVDGGDVVGSDVQVPLEILATARNVFGVTLSGTLGYLDANNASQVERKGSFTGMCTGRDQSECYVDQLQLGFSTVTAGTEPIVSQFGWQLDVELTQARM